MREINSKQGFKPLLQLESIDGMVGWFKELQQGILDQLERVAWETLLDLVQSPDEMIAVSALNAPNGWDERIPISRLLLVIDRITAPTNESSWFSLFNDGPEIVPICCQWFPFSSKDARRWMPIFSLAFSHMTGSVGDSITLWQHQTRRRSFDVPHHKWRDIMQYGGGRWAKASYIMLTSTIEIIDRTWVHTKSTLGHLIKK